MKRFLLVLLLAVALLAAPVSAHPGGTDENGGHYNHGNSSYHYHHGYSAHQHTGGVCPYDFDDRTGESSGTPSGGSSSSHSGSSHSEDSHSAAGSDSSFRESLIPDFSGSDEDNFLLACYSLVILAALFLSVAFKPVRIAVIVAVIAILAYAFREAIFFLLTVAFAALYLGYYLVYTPVTLLIDWIKSRSRK